MFHPAELFCLEKGGNLAQCWLAATCSEKQFKSRFKRSDICTIDIPKLCDDILMPIQLRNQYRHSLYLSAQLMYGVTKLMYYQTDYLLNELYNVNKFTGRVPRARRTLNLNDQPTLLEMEEPPSVSQGFINAQLNRDMHLLREELDIDDGVGTTVQDITCLNFGALTGSQMDFMLSFDEELSLRPLDRPVAPSGFEIEDREEEVPDVPMLDITESGARDSESRKSESRHSQGPTKSQWRDTIPVEDVPGASTQQQISSEGGPATPRKRTTDHIEAETPTKRRRDDTHESGPPLEVTTVPTDRPIAADSSLELESLHSSAFYELRKRNVTIIDKQIKLRDSTIIAWIKNVRSHTKPSDRITRSITSTKVLLEMPSMCMSTIRPRSVAEPVLKLFNDHISGPFTRVSDPSGGTRRADETIREHQTVNRYKDVADISKRLLGMTIETSEPSRASDRTELVPIEISAAPGPSHITENITETSVNAQLPDIPMIEQTFEADASGARAAARLNDGSDRIDTNELDEFLPDVKKKSTTRDETRFDSSSSTSFVRATQTARVCKKDILAILQVMWRDADVIRFSELIPTTNYNRSDAARAFVLLLELSAEKVVTVNQMTPYGEVCIQKYA